MGFGRDVWFACMFVCVCWCVVFLLGLVGCAEILWFGFCLLIGHVDFGALFSDLSLICSD